MKQRTHLEINHSHFNTLEYSLAWIHSQNLVTLWVVKGTWIYCLYLKFKRVMWVMMSGYFDYFYENELHFVFRSWGWKVNFHIELHVLWTKFMKSECGLYRYGSSVHSPTVFRSSWGRSVLHPRPTGSVAWLPQCVWHGECCQLLLATAESLW